jgi:hypothetical protein
MEFVRYNPRLLYFHVYRSFLMLLCYKMLTLFTVNNSHTIKRENLWRSDYRVPLDDIILAYAFRNLV